MSDLRSYLSDTAQRELESLRSTLDARLVALERALADPDGAESLEALIIDLARAATEEAHTSAARKWLEAQLAVEKSAAALPAPQVDGLRRELDEVRTELDRARADLDRERDRADGLRRDAEGAQAALQGERQASATLDAELQKARSAIVDLNDAVETLRNELDAARMSLAESQRELVTARREFDALKADVERSKASYDELFAQFEKADAAQKSAADALAAATERADKADLSAEAERERSAKAEEALRAGATAHADLQKRLEAASARVRELELKLFGREQTPPEGQDLDLGSMLEDAAPAEQPIRRFERYSFPSKIEVRFDEYDAQLVDLSVGGAQIVSAVAFDLAREAPMALVSDEIPVDCRAKVMWTRADPQSHGKTLRYRAGVQFIDADPAAVEAFIIRYSDINLYKRRQ